MVRPSARRAFGLGLGLLLGLCSLPAQSQSPETAQPPEAAEGSTFHDQELVTALDLLVGVELEGMAAVKAWGKGVKLPTGLGQEQFKVRVDGIDRPVVALEEIRDDRPVASEPWTQVIFVDVLGSRTRDLGMALDALAQRAEDLVELGPVQVVWRRSAGFRPKGPFGTETAEEEGEADPREVLATVMEPTRDGGELRKVLASLSLTVEGEDELSTVRYDLRRELLERPWTRRTAERRLAKGRELEASKIVAHQDTLLTYLADVALDAGARRALYWVTGGFDLEPEGFYRLGDGARVDSENEALTLRPVDLRRETEDFQNTLASYGWITYPVVPPKQDPLRGKGSGKRLGKWRFQGLMANYEAERLPKRAEAFYELGEAHRRAGQWQDAAEAYDRAYFHFWGDPRTQERQAAALAGLGHVLDHLDRPSEARQALEMAAELDPEVAKNAVRAQIEERATKEHWRLDEAEGPGAPLSIEDRLKFLHGALENRLRPLDQIARAGSGRRLADQRQVFRNLDDLRLRLRLTFQLEGRPEGRVHPVSAQWTERPEQRDALRVTRWIRSGVPPRLTRAIARKMLQDQRPTPGAEVDGLLQVEPLELNEGALEISVRGQSNVTFPRPLRLVLAAGGDGEPTRVHEQLWQPGDPPPSMLLRVHEPVLTVVWQDVETGAWGAERYPTGLD